MHTQSVLFIYAEHLIKDTGHSVPWSEIQVVQLEYYPAQRKSGVVGVREFSWELRISLPGCLQAEEISKLIRIES